MITQSKPTRLLPFLPYSSLPFFDFSLSSPFLSPSSIPLFYFSSILFHRQSKTLTLTFNQIILRFQYPIMLICSGVSPSHALALLIATTYIVCSINSISSTA